MEVNGAQATNILQNIIFHVQQKKKTHTGLENKWWQNLNFWVNYALNINHLKSNYEQYNLCLQVQVPTREQIPQYLRM